MVTIAVGQATLLNEAQPLGASFDPEVALTLLTPVLNQAPGSLELAISGGHSQDVVTVSIDGTDVADLTLDFDGNVGPVTVPVDSTLGTAGSHTVAVGTASATFTILLDPAAFPAAPGADAAPTSVSGAVIDGVRHWVLQDPVDEVDGGIGSWIMPINPDPQKTGSPFPQKTFTSKRSTASLGQWHIFQGATPPKEWSWGGYLPTEEMVARLLEFRALNRRFYVIDHRNRAWTCVLTHVEIVPRLRQVWEARGDEPLQTDWGTDYQVTCVILDPNWVTPS